jgi:hypothetical protein
MTGTSLHMQWPLKSKLFTPYFVKEHWPMSTLSFWVIVSQCDRGPYEPYLQSPRWQEETIPLDHGIMYVPVNKRNYFQWQIFVRLTSLHSFPIPSCSIFQTRSQFWKVLLTF